MPDEILVVPYNPAWPDLFRQLAFSLRDTLGCVALRIDHIGSTAVPGLDAKPVMDIQISVSELEPTDPFRLPLESLGFVFRPDNPELTKRYFREKPGTRRTHIHVRKHGSWNEQFALLFRDYMRAHEPDAREYADLKYRLAEKYRHDRRAYTDAKADFIWETMRKADAWASRTAWSDGPSDA